MESEINRLSDLLNNRLKFEEEISNSFSSSDDPYDYFLNLVFHSNKAKSSKVSSRTKLIISAFEEWSKTANTPLPSKSHKSKALDCAMGLLNTSILKKFAQIFRISNRETFVKPLVDGYLSNGHLEIVVQAVKLFNLESRYTFDELYFPMLCFNMRTDLLDCLANDQGLRLQYVKELDEICARKPTLDAAINSVRDKFPKQKYIPKNLQYFKKALSSTLLKWNIPIDECPHLLTTRKNAAVNYLATRYLEGEEMSIEALEDMAAIAVDNDRRLMNMMISRLINRDLEAAFRIAMKLKLPTEYWPEKLRFYAATRPTNCQVRLKYPRDYFWTFSLSNSNIIFVRDRTAYERSVDMIAKCNELGFDVEWRPSLGWSEERISLLQIATWGQVFLFDILCLSKCLSNDWERLLRKVLHNANILKIGYGIENDIDMFEETFGKAKSGNQSFHQFLDLGNFFSWLSKHHPEILPMLDPNYKSPDSSGAKKDGQAKGLSGFCQSILGKPLNKAEQVSDWEQRPLRQAQIEYAVLDAFCLLQIYERLSYVLVQMGLNERDMLEKFQKVNKSNNTTEKKKENFQTVSDAAKPSTSSSSQVTQS